MNYLRKKREERGGPERGSGLIEVMFALLIMLFLMLGVLRMFSMISAENMGSAARTAMLYKCQQVVENIRMVSYLNNKGIPISAATGIPFPLAATSAPIYLPTSGSGTGFSFWGPDGANVLGTDNGSGGAYVPPPYKLYYSIATGSATNLWLVTVTAVPNKTAGSPKYLGLMALNKKVEYVAQLQ